MLENYRVLPNGVVEQIERKPFDYSSSYIHAYDKLECKKMSQLRFNNIVNSIGYIPHSTLDYGYGNGAFLKYALDQDVKCYGYDVTGEPLPKGCEPTIEGLEYVECICLYDSLEHTDDIQVTINNLPKHKYIIITVPCLRQDYNEEWFSKWRHAKPNEHLFHFTPSALINFMFDNNYAIVSLNHCEDAIRKPTDEHPNITTGVFRKI